MVQCKEFIDYFLQDLSDQYVVWKKSAILKKILLKWSEVITLSESIGSLKNQRLIYGPVPQIDEDVHFVCTNTHVLTFLKSL